MAQVYNTSIKNIRKLLLQKICQVNKTLINAPALIWVLKKKVRQYNFLEKHKRWECDRVCMFNRHRCSRKSPYKTFWFTCFRRKTLVCCSSWWSEVKFLLWLWSCRSSISIYPKRWFDTGSNFAWWFYAKYNPIDEKYILGHKNSFSESNWYVYPKGWIV